MSDQENTPLLSESSSQLVPVLPLRDVVVYPHMVIPLFVGREKSIEALDAAMQDNKKILLLAQKNAEVDDPSQDDLYEIGALSTILQMLKLPDGTIKVLVEGGERVIVESLLETNNYFSATVQYLEKTPVIDEKEAEVLIRSVLNLFDQYVKLNKKVPPEILTSLSGIDDPSRLADTISAHMSLKLDEKQEILEIRDPRQRLEHIMSKIEGEIDLMHIEKRIRGRVKQQMEKSQREYYLNEQMKAIQKELGEMDDAPNEVEDLQNKIEQSGMSKEAREKADSELNKLKMMSPMSAEATVVRNYIDWLVSVPWKKKSKIRRDLCQAEDVLEADSSLITGISDSYCEALLGVATEMMATDPDAAKSYLLKALDINPASVPVLSQLGFIYVRDNDYQRAIDTYQKVAKLEPHLPDTFFNLGYIYAVTEDYSNAEQMYARVVALSPDFLDEALVNLAVVQDQLGQRDKCLKNLKQAIEINPANESAATYLEQLKEEKE